MGMLIGAARAYVREAATAADTGGEAWNPDHGVPCQKCSHPRSPGKWSPPPWNCTEDGASSKEAGIEKLVRDAAAWHHSDGANRTLLLKAARALHASVSA